MSNLFIRQALEIKIAAIVPALDTAFENDGYSPEADIPFQEIQFLFAKAENPTFGDGFYRQRGIMQVTLRYPQQIGSNTIGTRAELIRQTFRRGLSLSKGGVITRIDETPSVSGGKVVEDRFIVIVRINFYADLIGA